MHPSALAVHADFGTVIFQYIGEIFTVKLTIIVVIEYLRCAVVCQHQTLSTDRPLIALSAVFLRSTVLNDRALCRKYRSPAPARRSCHASPSGELHRPSCGPVHCRTQYRLDQAIVFSSPEFGSGVHQITPQFPPVFCRL